MPHHKLLPILLLTLPFIELYLLIRAGAAFGYFNVLLWVLAAAALGFRLLQSRSWTIWNRLQQSLRQHEHPARELLDSAIVMMGALLLILPGFVTDLLGLICLIPVSRAALAAYLEKHGEILLASPGPAAQHHDTIEGEFRREE